MAEVLLLTNDRLINQPLAENNSLVRPLYALLHDTPRSANDATGHGKPLVVKVAHDDNESVVLLTEQVINWHLDIIILHKCSSGRERVRGLDGRCFDTFLPGNEDDGESLFGAAGGNKVVGKGAVGDPFLGSVDNVVFAIGGLGGRGAESGYVRASECCLELARFWITACTNLR
jgi:hypothetical protein